MNKSSEDRASTMVGASALPKLAPALLCARRWLAPALSFAIAPCSAAQRDAPPARPAFAGVHEAGVYAAHSFKAGSVLGFTQNTTYTTVVAHYSYQLHTLPYGTLRWTPELTVLAVLHEPYPSPDGIHSNVPTTSYAAGLSPAGLQFVFLPGKRIQPFVGANGGFLLYNQPVLSDGGTRFMFTVDAGLGASIFVKPHDAIQFNYRYQHQSNADIGQHNPGADANQFILGYSHFFTLR